MSRNYSKYNKTYNQSQYKHDQTGYQANNSVNGGQLGPNGKNSVTCRYWKQGTCKLGDQCRFLHADATTSNIKKPKFSSDIKGTNPQYLSQSNSRSVSPNPERPSSASTLSSSSSSIDATDLMCTTPISERDGRRPFLQIVVLYANDSRVFNYSKEVQNQFLENGIDVYLQIGIENVLSRENQRVSYHDKLEKDTEIKTENLAEIITSSIADFLIVIGDRNMKNKSCQAKKRGKLVEMNVEDMIHGIWTEWSPYQTTRNEAEAESVSIPLDRLQMLLDEHFGLKHLNDRRSRIETQLAMVLGKKDEKKFETFPSEIDGKLATNLTNLQKMFIRLHEPLTKAYDTLSQIISEEPIIVDQSQYGSKVGPEYRPQNSPKSLPPIIKEKLMEYLEELIDKIEENARAMMDEYGAPLWGSYYEQYRQNSEYIMSSEELSYGEDDYDSSENNEEYAPDTPVDYDSENEWESVGSSAKKGRKKVQEQSSETRKPDTMKPKMQTPQPKPTMQVKQILTSKEHPDYPMRKDSQDFEYKNQESDSTYPLQGQGKEMQSTMYPNEEMVPQEHVEKSVESQYPLMEDDFSGLKNHDYSDPEYLFIYSLWKSMGSSSCVPDTELGVNTFKNWIKVFQPNAYDIVQTNYDGRIYRNFGSGFQTSNENGEEGMYGGYPSNYETNRIQDNAQDHLPDFPPESTAKRPCLYCGEESTIDCNLCAKNNKDTHFCCIEHQLIMWKKHVNKTHRSPSFVYSPPMSPGFMTHSTPSTSDVEYRNMVYVYNHNKVL